MHTNQIKKKNFKDARGAFTTKSTIEDGAFY